MSQGLVAIGESDSPSASITPQVSSRDNVVDCIHRQFFFMLPTSDPPAPPVSPALLQSPNCELETSEDDSQSERSFDSASTLR